MAQLAVRTRSGRVDSVHEGYICITDSNKNVLYSIGNPYASIFIRSSGKPLYAVTFVNSGAMDKYHITLKELAIICSSHEGQAFHRQIILSILNKLGLKEKDLDCGSIYPGNQKVHDALIMLGKRPTPVFNNCSGKHVGMLALCRFYNYPIEGYTRPDHPLQQLIRKTMAEMLEIDEEEIILGKDGCTIPTYLLTLKQVSWLYACLAHGYEGKGKYSECFGLIQKAMTTYPKVIGGKGTFCTDLITHTKGRAIGKIGAEGVYMIAVPEKHLGVCINIFDGHPWASFPVAVRVLEELDILDGPTVKKLEKWALPPIKDDKGNDVGYIHPSFSLVDNNTSQYQPGDIYP